MPNAKEVGEKVTAGRVPVPLRAAVWGLPTPLSATESEAVLEPIAVGVKVMLMVQFAPTATLVPQLLVCAKLPAFVPVIEMPVMVSTAVPVFDKVTVWAALVVFSS